MVTTENESYGQTLHRAATKAKDFSHSRIFPANPGNARPIIRNDGVTGSNPVSGTTNLLYSLNYFKVADETCWSCRVW